MSVDLVVRAGVALAATVFLLLTGVGFVRFLQKRRGIRGRGRYLRIIETLELDQKRRLVFVQCGARFHLLLIGGATDVVVDRVDHTVSSRPQEQGDSAAPHL